MELRDILEKLTSTFGDALSDTICSLLPRGCEINKSPLGNLSVRFSGESEDAILLDAHMDTIHFVVTAITPEGFIKVAPCGGVDCRVLSGSEVTVWGTEPLYGVFTVMPPHLKKTGSSNASSVEEQAIDIGCSFERVNQLVTLGDAVTFRSNFTPLINSRYSSSGLDNLAGVAVLISLSHKLSKMKLKNTVILQFSNYEETGHRFAGATTGAFAFSPKEAVVIDASFAKAPALNYAAPGEMGNGAMIGFSPMLSQEISCAFRDLAKENQIPFTQEIMGGSSGTNADGVVTTANGIPTGLLSYPLLNMHTPVEVVSEKDLKVLEQLLELYCQKGGSANE